MNFTVDTRNHTYIFRLREERLNARIAPDLKAQLLLLISDETGNNILLDLTKVKFVDSSGLGALLLGLRQARANERQFALLGTQKRVSKLIHIAQVGNVLTSYNDEAEALAGMAEGA
ncbi:MAG TPA: STAS domain-containing protein [bacterium]|nr:STAS domain-containing protein [bacterium]HQG45076.1 STAS domain-containing protein [bacterium]HQI47204.1 STAS domain-containing protein [bacterium]HQJ65170.1 STAS domain-containing protein [bacterium]